MNGECKDTELPQIPLYMCIRLLYMYIITQVHVCTWYDVHVHSATQCLALSLKFDMMTYLPVNQHSNLRRASPLLNRRSFTPASSIASRYGQPIN